MRNTESSTRCRSAVPLKESRTDPRGFFGVVKRLSVDRSALCHSTTHTHTQHEALYTFISIQWLK